MYTREKTHNLEQRKTKPKYTRTFSIILWCASFGWKEKKVVAMSGTLEKTSNKPNTYKEGLYRPDVLAAVFCARRGMISNGTRIIWKIFPRIIFF